MSLQKKKTHVNSRVRQDGPRKNQKDREKEGNTT